MPDMASSVGEHNHLVRQEARFLITGAKGCIGAWIVKNLIQRGSRPVIFDSDPRSHRLRALLTDDQIERIVMTSGDITEFDDIDRAVAENGITHVIHLAALQ